jgi:hypothetical protein
MCLTRKSEMLYTKRDWKDFGATQKHLKKARSYHAIVAHLSTLFI